MLNLTGLEETLAKEPIYRLKQAKQSIFRDLISDWSAAYTLPQALREELNRVCPLDVEGVISISKDRETVKVFITLADGEGIESVLLEHADGRNTVCVSSQVGCPLACTFCLTGQMGFKRNLSASEIVAQVLFADFHLDRRSH